MGYNLTITRRKNHFDEDGPSITDGEWQALVEADPQLSFSKGENGPLFAYWNGDCQSCDAWFDYSAEYGSIDTKNPDERTIAKMLEMAAKLGAKVQGDDGEIYRSPTETYDEDDDAEQDCDPPRPWWKRLFG